MNNVKTIGLMTLLTVLLVLAGNALGGRAGAEMFFMIALIMNFTSYWFSDKIVLKMYHAQEVNEQDAPQLIEMIRRLTRNAELPMPRVYIIPQETPNAFATGRNPSHAAVAVTQGILRILSPQELRGVLSHELAHVKNRDILIGTIAAAIAGAITMLASIARWAALFGGLGGDDDDGGGLAAIVMMILAPIAAMLIQMAISRSREYQADATGSGFCGAPLSLASALEKLEAKTKQIPMQQANPATAHMFIVNPLSAKSMMSLFSTHPPISQRVERLQKIARDLR